MVLISSFQHIIVDQKFFQQAFLLYGAVQVHFYVTNQLFIVVVCLVSLYSTHHSCVCWTIITSNDSKM